MKLKQQLICLVMMVCLISGLFFNLAFAVVTADPVQNLVKAKPVTGLQHSATFQGRGDGVRICPVTGEKITHKKFKGDYFGRTVYFCCKGCEKAAQREPDRFIKPTLAEQQQSVKAYLAKASQSADDAEFCNE